MTSRLLYYGITFLLSSSGTFAQPSFPSFTVNQYGNTNPGYYFITLNDPELLQAQLIMDETGHIVYYKTGFYGDFHLQPNGMLSYNDATRHYLLDSTFTTVDSIICGNDFINDFHDFRVLPNGHYLLLGSEIVLMDLSFYYMFNQNGSPGSENAYVTCGVIQELDESGNVVFEWHALDYFHIDETDEYFLANPNIVDWTHFNSVELDNDENLLLSSRHLNEITKISRSDGSIIWRLGGKKNEFVFMNETLPFFGQHDIQRLANGNITLFDNGSNYVSHAARAVEYQLDEVNKTATKVWSYTPNPAISSEAMGNTQRLPNGNTLINLGLLFNDNLMFRVVDASGNSVFDIRFYDTLSTYRAYSYSSLPWSLNQPAISCFYSGNGWYLDAGPGYASYQWSTGATSQTIPVSTTGTYYVYVPKGEGGFVSSPLCLVTNLNDPCAPISVSEINDGLIDLIIAPNPVDDYASVSFSLLNPQHIEMELRDIFGRVIKTIAVPELSQGHHILQIDMADLQGGMYFVRIGDHCRKVIHYE